VGGAFRFVLKWGCFPLSGCPKLLDQNNGGWLSFKGQEFRVSKALTGYPVALRPQPEQDGGFDLFFCHQKVDSLDLVSMTSED
jgi:hypothetical protein